MKRPNGILVEECAADVSHYLEGGQWIGHDEAVGLYTGRFCFHFADGRCTRWYTQKTAPAWLLALYHEMAEQEARSD